MENNGWWLLQLKEAGCISKGARKAWLGGPLWQMGRFKRPQGRLLRQLEVPQRQLRGRVRGKEYSLFKAKIGPLQAGGSKRST